MYSIQERVRYAQLCAGVNEELDQVQVAAGGHRWHPRTEKIVKIMKKSRECA